MYIGLDPRSLLRSFRIVHTWRKIGDLLASQTLMTDAARHLERSAGCTSHSTTLVQRCKCWPAFRLVTGGR